MKILFYLGHPAQYHFSKNIILRLREDGHSIKILLKTKDILESLVSVDGFEYTNIQETVRKNNKISILLASLKRTLKVCRSAKKFQADILIGTDSSVSQSAYLLRKKSITTLEDDYDVIKKLAKLTYPFSSSIVVPTECSVGKKWESKKISYSGYMKLAYLHLNVFKPNEKIVEKYFNKKKYCIVRLAGLTAHHDIGIKGLDIVLVKSIINRIESKGYTVYVSSEALLADDLLKYQLRISQSDIHHVLYYASLLISDSQSMSVEAAMLGTPSIRFSDFAGRISVLEELEHTYGLTFGVKTNESDKLYQIVENLLALDDIKAEFQNRRQKMLSEKIDVTAFFVWFIENYPQSVEIMKKNPDYQYNFK